MARLLLAASATASAQTMARPGWAGSGLNADPWWKQAVFYQIAAAPADPPHGSHVAASQPGVDFKAITARLDALHSLGIDALLLPMPSLPVQAPPQASGMGAVSTPGPDAPPPPAPDAAGSESPSPADFDELIDQAGRHGLRVLLTFTASSVTADLPAMAEFWLSRGVAGFHIVTPPATSPRDTDAILQAVRKVISAAVGQRILISDFYLDASDSPDAAPPSTQPAHRENGRRTERTSGAELRIDARLSRLELPDAASLRPLLAQSLAEPNLLLALHAPPADAGAPNPYTALAKVMSAIQLTTHSAALIDFPIDSDQQIDLPATPPQSVPAPPAHASPAPRPASPPTAEARASRGSERTSLADWYRELSALHHDNAALRDGSVTLLNFDEQNALVWVSRPASGAGLTPPVVAACNLSAKTVELSLAAAIKGLDLRGSFLRTLLRSDQAMGAQNLNSVIVPAFGVYIGELRR